MFLPLADVYAHVLNRSVDKFLVALEDMVIVTAETKVQVRVGWRPDTPFLKPKSREENKDG